MSLAMAGMTTATSKATGIGHLIFRVHTSLTIFTALSIKGCITTELSMRRVEVKQLIMEERYNISQLLMTMQS